MISCIKAFVAFRAHRVFRRVPFREKVQETHEFNTELVWHIRHSYGTVILYAHCAENFSGTGQAPE
eukprot:1187484-Prorocentrum_minimum.AAC.2